MDKIRKLFILHFLLIACTFRILGSDSLELELLSICSFTAGERNGQPSTQDDPLVEKEFAVLSSEGNTVQVRDSKNFPQVLHPEQRIAILKMRIQQG